MRILLLNPPLPLKKSYFTTPPIGLMCLASTLREKNHHVKILDLFSFSDKLDNLKELLINGSFDVVGITGMSIQHNTMLRISKIVKMINNNIITVFGGPHASALPDFLLKEDCIDFLFRGEADFSFPAFLDVINEPNKWENIPGLCFKNGDEIKISEPEILKDVDLLPIPAWDLIEFKNYMRAPHGLICKKEPIGQIITSRGCPYLCTFCAAHATHSNLWRSFSPDRVLDEIDYLVNVLNIRELHIEDDNFSLNIKRAKIILKKIIKKEYNLSIAFPNGMRLDKIDDELLKLMKAAGVYSIAFGIESGSANILKRIKKKISLEFIKNQLKMIKKYKFDTEGFFIIGFPFEKKIDIYKTIDFALKLDLDAAFFGIYIPLPGSSDFQDLIEKGRINLENINWDNMFSSKSQDFSFYLLPNEIENYQNLATRKFYFRIRIILINLIKIMRNIKNLSRLFKRFKAVL